MIKCVNISKKQGKYGYIFCNFNHEFPSTGMVILAGDNGVGKTTLLFILGMLDSDYEGDLLINGVNLKEISRKRYEKIREESVLYTGPSHHLLNSLNLRDNLLFYAPEGTPVPESGIDLFKFPSEVSGGEEQLIAIKRAFYTSKNILLFDEITSFLDDSNTYQIMVMLKELSKDKLIILASHDPRAWPYADFVVRMGQEND